MDLLTQGIAMLVWLITTRRLALMGNSKQLITMLTALLMYDALLFYVATIAIGGVMLTGCVDSRSKIMMHTTNIKKETYENVTAVGRALFESRANIDDNNDRIRMRWYKVNPVKREPSDVCRGDGRLRLLLPMLGTTKFKNVVELGVGAGGWTHVMSTESDYDLYLGYSRWNQPGQQPLLYHQAKDDPRVHLYPKNIEHILGSKMDEYETTAFNDISLLLADFGENAKVTKKLSYDEIHGVYLDDVAYSKGVLDKLEPFIQMKPKHFIIRIPNIMNNDVTSRLTEWQRLLGQGNICRLSDERNNVDVAYFISGSSSDIENKALSIGYSVLKNIEESPYDTTTFVPEADGLIVYGKRPKWEKIKDCPVKKLEPYDMTETIKAKGKMHAPLHTTKFLREIGWWPSPFMGSGGTQYNAVALYFVSRIRSVMDDFNQWRTTSTKPKDTYRTVLKKVDSPPKENHKYTHHMWAVYRALSDYIRARGIKLERQTDEEIGENLNRTGAMGDQENHLRFNNLGEYFDSNTWQERVAAFEESLRKGRPINADYNSIGKKERKKTSSSRLIWFQCATARLYEARLLGNIDNIVKKLPYSVSGAPLYDYGEMLAEIFKPGMKAIADDVAGWDTKVSYVDLCMECEFLKRLTDDEDYKRDIERVYRMYAFPMVNITRDMNGQVQNVLYQLRGQVASGRRVTYSMNTITNIVVTMTRAAVSQGVDLDSIYDWALTALNNGHSGKYGGKISGDDAVIIMDAPEAKKFAKEGADFMNEIGMPRKNLRDSDPSPIYSRLEDVDFCSHSFTQINKPQGGTRWMPTRSASEIIAKATIFMGNLREREQQMAWARANALNMLVNYFHMPTIRDLAMSLLDATPVNIALDDVAKGWSYKARPWLSQGRAVDILSKCYADCLNPLQGIDSIVDLPYASSFQLRPHELNRKAKDYRKWKYELPKYIRAVRDSGHGSWKYDDTGYMNFNVDLLSTFSQPFKWGYRKTIG